MADLIFLALGLGVFAVFLGYAVLLEARLTMIALIYAVAALGVAIYLVAALLRPDKF